jgi:hypothetical protein
VYMKQNDEASFSCFKKGGEEIGEGGDDGGNLINVQYRLLGIGI